MLAKAVAHHTTGWSPCQSASSMQSIFVQSDFFFFCSFYQHWWGLGKKDLSLHCLFSAAFIRVVGSEFVQKYLGEGPRMVRDVFRLAKENAPAIIFIDEIDAIATKRFDAQTGGKKMQLGRRHAQWTGNTLCFQLLFCVFHIILTNGCVPCVPAAADREVQRILLELLNQMDGFDQNVNVKVSFVWVSMVELYFSVNATLLQEHHQPEPLLLLVSWASKVQVVKTCFQITSFHQKKITAL